MAYNQYGQNWMNQPGYVGGYNPGTSYYSANQPVQPLAQRPVFVDGEMSARVFQMPDNWPIGIPLYLWDTNGDYFYVKVIGPNGVPMPLQKFRYQKEENEAYGHISGNGAPQVDTSQFVTKDAFEQQMNELKELLKTNKNAQQNRGMNV